MIEDIVVQIKSIVSQLHSAILEDIEDVKKARHESLVQRNDIKIILMDKLVALKQKLNDQLSIAYKNGEDITVYRVSINQLEENLGELYRANGKLGSIVLPVKEMYKEIIDEISARNGGTLIEVMA